MAPICGVCAETVSRYTCPHCEMKYCTVKCFKQHISQHDNDIPTSDTVLQGQDALARPETTSPQSAPELDDALEQLKQNQQFKKLLARYPQLKRQLKDVYMCTLDPDTLEQEGYDMEKFNWNSRLRGPWTQQKADEKALNMLLELQEEFDSVGEFLELIKMLVPRST